MVSNLYDVKDRSGKTIIENVTFGEVVEHLNFIRFCLLAEMQERRQK